jgi:hypothetical protein
MNELRMEIQRELDLCHGQLEEYQRAMDDQYDRVDEVDRPFSGH